MKCQWVKLCPEEGLIREISEKHNLSPILARVLINNNIVSDQEIDDYLYPDKGTFHDPFLLKDVQKVVDYLIKIRSAKESIVIYGDYDVDGVTSTAMFYLILKQLGWKVSYYIPSRLEEGYGLSKTAIIDLFNQKIRNIITVDCGISSFKEVAYANFLNFKVIITDHHEVQDKLPEALAIVNPKRSDDTYPDKGLAGVGVAFKVMDALLRKLGNPIDIMDYLDLVTLGTVADIVPLRGENRIIVRKGMKSLATTKRIGLKKLMEISGINIEQIMTQDIGFKIAPRLNAVGRLQSAYAALKLLLSEDEVEGLEIARYLTAQNEKRQLIENQIYQDAEIMLKEDPTLGDAPILVLGKEDWHPGVIGIVSSRLSAKYYKPTLLMSLDFREDVARGSGRSIEQVNIMEILGKAEIPDLEYGGHPMAAGFTVATSQQVKIREQILKAYKQLYGEETFTSKIYIDSELPLQQIDQKLMDSIEILKPFGQCNHEPTFLISNASIDRMKILGNHSQHIRLILKQEDSADTAGKAAVLDCIGFNLSERLEDFRYIRPNLLKADCVGNIKTFWHFGVKHIQFSLKDIQFSIDPSLKEEEADKTFIKSIVDSKEEAHEASPYPNVDVLKKDLEHKLFTKYSELQKVFQENNRFAVFANTKIQDSIISLKCLHALQRDQKICFISPTVSFSLFRAQVVKKIDILPIFSYPTAHGKAGFGDCYFTTLPFFLKNFEELKKNYQNMVFLDMEVLFQEKLNAFEALDHLSLLLKKESVEITVIGTHLSSEKKERLKKVFPVNGLLTEPLKAPRTGLVDRRGMEDAIPYIQALVKKGQFVCVIVQRPEKTVELTREFGKSLSEYFHNGEVVFYNQQLKPFQKMKIEDLIVEKKVRLLITTPDFGSNLRFPLDANLCILEPLKNPLEIFMLTNALATPKSNGMLHLLYSEEEETDSFPDNQKNFVEKNVLFMLKLACSDGMNDWKELYELFIEKGYLKQNTVSSHYLLFRKIGLLEDQKIINKQFTVLAQNFQELPEFLEAKWEQTVTDSYRNAFNHYQAKRILELFDFPFLPLL